MDWFLVKGEVDCGDCGETSAPVVSDERSNVGGRLGESGGPRDGGSPTATRVDPKGRARSGSIAPVLIRGRLRKEGGVSGLTLSPSGKGWERDGADVSAHLIKAMIVPATRARPWEVPSMRSSGRNRSSGGSPLAEHVSRNFVTFDLRSTPSSHGPICVIDPGQNLFKSLVEACVSTIVHRLRGQRKEAKTYWHRMYPSCSAFANNRCALSSPTILAPRPVAFPGAPNEVVLPLIEASESSCPHTISNRRSARIRTLTTSNSRFLRPVWCCSISLQSIEVAVRTAS